MSAPIRVLLADDQVLLRGSLRLLLETTPGMAVVAEAGTGAEAVELCHRHRPEIVLMDVRMPDVDGLEATRRICASPATAACRVLILTTFDLDVYVYAALRAGASGFVLKDMPPAELLAAIAVVAAGDALLSPRVTRRLIAQFARLPDPRAPAPQQMSGLTEREREIVRLVAGGLSNGEIGERLRLSLATVKTHVGHVLAKLALRDRTQLVIAAYESGLVVPGAPSGPGDGPQTT